MKEIEKVTLVRGLPGSGKSTYAKKMGIFHIESDMYFYRNGIYTYDPLCISTAHYWCKKTFENACLCGIECVVSNTFTQKWELDPYIKIAEGLGYTIEIICMKGKYGNIHNVPKEILEQMENRFEQIDGEIFI